MTSEAGRRACVLVVEDDAETQGFMKILLGRRYDVRLASSGDEMRRIMEETDGPEIAIVLMDLSLKGGEDGLQLTRALRADAAWKNVPIVAVTAHAFPVDRANALAAGCDAYLEKPIDNHNLLRTIEKLI
jgi:two-component system, cell cycle response regulator DivK